MVDICLIFSQSGFCCAYVFFIKENYSDILKSAWEVDVSPTVIAWICFVVFTLLCFVRKIEVFAPTHMFANVMIILTVVIVVVYGVVALGKNGTKI
jgi:amino acid permease